jgi:chromosome segregation ATPase
LEPDTADQEDMAIEPLQTLQLTADPPAEVAHLGVVPGEGVIAPAIEELAELQRRLETERSASRALIAALRELEQRVDAERATAEALTVSVGELEAALEADRAALSAQRKANGQLWSQVHDLKHALELAERPIWRKLLRR